MGGGFKDQQTRELCCVFHSLVLISGFVSEVCGTKVRLV